MDLILIYLVMINAITFFVYGMDKWKAKKGKHRISERALLLLTAAYGSVGACVGMWFFRHKIRKPKFYLGVPALLLFHIVLAVFLYYCL